MDEMREPQKYIVTINGKATSPLFADMADRLVQAAHKAQPTARIEKRPAPASHIQKGLDRVRAGYGDEDDAKEPWLAEASTEIPAKMVTQGFVVEYDPVSKTVVISKRGQELDRFTFKGVPKLGSFQKTIAQRVKALEDDLYGADQEPGVVSLSRMKIPGRGYGYQELGEDTASAPAEQAILRRIMIAHTDLLKQFGPDKVMQAVEEVAYNIGDVDEIGTSDVSGWVHEVKQILGAE